MSSHFLPSQIIQTTIAEAIYTGFGVRLNCHEIILNPIYPRYSTHYTSPVAIALAHRLGQDALTIAEAIVTICNQICLQVDDRNSAISSKWQMQAIGKGWLNITFTDLYLAEILLFLEKWQVEGINNVEGIWQKHNFHSDSNLTEANYAYARCCALIRLAYREHLLPLAAEVLPQNICIGMETVELSLLMQNLAIADYFNLAQENGIDRDSKKAQEKLDKFGRSLSELFLQFYAQCRILGVSRHIAIRRLLLISSTQKILLAIAPSNVHYLPYL